jgi:hypothetical protein
MAFSLVIPPEHVHAADAHHSHAIAHRHLEEHEHDGTEIDHGEGRVLWLDRDLALQQAVYQFTADCVAVPTHLHTTPELHSWMFVSILDAAPAHGPPRPNTSLRGPPALPPSDLI